MLNYTYKQIEKAVRGSRVVTTRRGAFKGKVSLDTRTLEKGDCYIALRGQKFDGHDFVDEAFKKGARLCIAASSCRRLVNRKDPDIIFVEDTTQALGRLGAFHRRQKKIPVIAVTGSAGKTTTKDLIAHFLSSRYKVLKNQGTENNLIGVPKTLLQLDDQDIVVLELGSNRPGEIRRLARIANPTYAVLTLIGNAHLMGFRSLQGVKREKLSLIDAMDEVKAVIYNGGDPNLAHPQFKKVKTVRVGFSKRFDFFANQVHLMQDGAIFRFNAKHKMHTQLLGRHNVLNILLAAATASQFGVTVSKFIPLVKNFKAARGRMRYQKVNRIHWIDDSYNANPSSLKAAIELFKSYPPEKRKILVLGDMLELGVRASDFHREAGKTIADYPFDMVLTVGNLCKRFVDEAIQYGFDKSKIKAFATSEAAGRYLKRKLAPSDTVLLKGSRGMHMERVMEICGVPQ